MRERLAWLASGCKSLARASAVEIILLRLESWHPVPWAAATHPTGGHSRADKAWAAQDRTPHTLAHCISQAAWKLVQDVPVEAMVAQVHAEGRISR